MYNNYDDDDMNIGKKASSLAGKGIGILVNKLLGIKGKLIILGIIVAILVILFIVYVIYFFLFGWTFKVEQDLEEARRFIYYTESDSHFNEQGYYRYQDQEGELWYIYYDLYNEKQKKSESDFLKDAYGFSLLLDSGEVDISTGDTLLLDDSDVDKIFDKILEAEEKRYERVLKTYKWGSKLYDYELIPTYWPDGSYTYEKSDTPVWQPDDVWEPTVASHWDIHTDSVELFRNDIEGEVDPADGTPRFMVHWQTVTGICEMTSSQDYSNWGNTGDGSNPEFEKDEYGDMDGYYLSDETVQQIVDALSYEFEFYYDGADKNKRAYEYEDMEKIAYILEKKEMEAVTTPGETAYVKKIPATAPKAIKNIYEEYIYNYVPVEDGYGAYICVGRTKYTNAVAFVQFLEALCPQFDYDEFMEIVEHFPSAEGDLARLQKLKAIYEWQKETGEPYFVEELNEPCFSNGVRIGTEFSESMEETPPFDDPYLGDGYLDGDFDYVWVAGGWYAISEGARTDLNTSDGLTRDQIYNLLNFIWIKYGAPETCRIIDATDAVYQWQQDTGGSVTGIFGIWMQEGAMSTTIGRDHWNLGNFTAGKGDKSFKTKPTSKYNWADFKAMYSDIGSAIAEQLRRVRENYWNKGQNTYFAMSWKTVHGIYAAQGPEDACPQSDFSHCYCPYWEDSAFAVTSEKVPNPAYSGWSNKCAYFRSLLLNKAKGM